MCASKKLDRLNVLWGESREEIRLRIRQRDQYFLSINVAIAALVVGSSRVDLLVSLIPPISLYFSVFLYYSHRTHEILVDYLKIDIEPKIKEQLGSLLGEKYEDYKEYEQMFESVDTSNQRKWIHRFLVPYGSIIAIVFSANAQFDITLYMTLVSAAICVAIWLRFFQKHELWKKKR